MSRREFLGAATALGTMALASCAAREEAISSLGAVRIPGQLPTRGEFIVKNAHVLTMDPKLGEISGGDIHVRDGAIVAVGRNLSASGAETIRADNMIALPGFVETHWHMWGAVARNMAGPTENTGYFYISRLLGQFFTPEDNAEVSALRSLRRFSPALPRLRIGRITCSGPNTPTQKLKCTTR